MSTLIKMLSSLPVIFVLLAGTSATLFAFLHRGARLSPEPWYAREHVLGTVLAPMVVILLACAVGMAVELVSRWNNSTINVQALPMAGVLALAFAAVVVLLHRATPKAPAQPAAGAPTVTGVPASNGPDAPTDRPPGTLPVDRAA